MPEPVIAQRSALHDVAEQAAQSALIETRVGESIVQIAARKGQASVVGAKIRTLFGIELPRPGSTVCGGGVVAIWRGPDSWLIVGDGAGGRDLEAELSVPLAGIASIIDSSDAWTLIDITGGNALELLAKFVPIDLDARSFPAGASAGTHASHIGVIVWRLADHGFRLAVGRSYAETLWTWLLAAGANIRLR